MQKQIPASIYIKIYYIYKTYVSKIIFLVVITCMYSLWSKATLKSE
jgi:hypothetical protein